MATTLAGNGSPANYVAPVRVAYERAAERIGGISAETLHQFVHGRVKAPERLAILAEELVKLECFEQANAIVAPQVDALEKAPPEDFYQLIPIVQCADSAEDCAESKALLYKDAVSIERFLSENDDQITKSIRLRRAGYALLAEMKRRTA